MNRKTKIVVSVAGIFIVTLALIGLTFGYYLTRINGNTNPKSISASTQKLELTYSDNSSEIIGDGKELMPSNEPIGSKTFTVTNNGGDTNYSVVLEDMSIKDATTNEETTFESNDFRYTLTCIDKSGNNCGSTITEQTILSLSNGVLINNDIAKNDLHTYTLTIWYLETGVDQSNDMGKSLIARINIIDPSKENPYRTNKSLLAFHIVNNAINRTNGTEFLTNPKTKVAEEVSQYGSDIAKITDLIDVSYNLIYIGDTESDAQNWNVSDTSYNECTNSSIGKYIIDSYEAIPPSQVIKCDDGEYVVKSKKRETTLSMTNDDYGVSYYYRGDVTDNYLTFAGMCWRIVRIEGDGSTKLILEDNDEPCSSSMNGNWAIPTTIGGTNYTGDYGNSYEGKYIMKYLEPVTISGNPMVKVFYNFQISRLSDYLTKLKAGNWCLNDKAYIKTGNRKPYTYTMLEEYNYSGYMYYDSYARLLGDNVNGYQPTLKCNGTKLNEFKNVANVSSEAPMYVGAITADEVVYAGGTYSTINANYYLINEEFKKGSNGENKSSSFWTLSPSEFGVHDKAFYVDNSGKLGYYYVSESRPLRPVINLLSGTQITSGNGTIDNPYIIQ